MKSDTGILVAILEAYYFYRERLFPTQVQVQTEVVD
jgi:hypothetical protein